MPPDIRSGDRVRLLVPVYACPSKPQLRKGGPYRRVDAFTAGVARHVAVDEYGVASVLVRLDNGGWTQANAALVQRETRA